MVYGNTRYSSAQYGRELAEQRQPREQDRDRFTDGVDPEDAFGAGIRLATRDDVENGRADYHWDPVPDEDGAFASTHGLRELMKDTAYRLARRAHALRGGLLNTEALTDGEIEIQQVAINDERVADASATVRQSSRQPDTVEVEMTVVGLGGQRAEGVFGYDPSADTITAVA